VWGDANRLQQVFMNLILNAVHAMPRGGTLSVGTKSRPSPDGNPREVEVFFRDTGKGIRPDMKDKIFEPFFTTSYAEGRKGTGLGLPISYTIVETHKGRIEVESEGIAGRGSTFRVILPVYAGGHAGGRI
ncbi:MAG: ATP-binding protein, partial [Candidatus Omnitrophota bacterium]